jgi:hypothetical protein
MTMSDQPTLRDTVEETVRAHAFYRVSGAAKLWRCTCNWWETRSLRGDSWQAHFTDALTTAVQPWLDGQAWADLTAERDALTALTAECSCATTYATYEGPEPDCPVHGAVRAFNEASAENARLRAALAVADAREQAVRELCDEAERWYAKPGSAATTMGGPPAITVDAIRHALSAVPVEEAL